MLSQNDEFDKLAMEVENKMKFVGFMGIKDIVNDMAINLMEKIINTSIKPWVLSGDNYQNIMRTCFELKILNSHSKIFEISSLSKEELTGQIRQAIQHMQSYIDKEDPQQNQLKITYLKD